MSLTDIGHDKKCVGGGGSLRMGFHPVVESPCTTTGSRVPHAHPTTGAEKYKPPTLANFSPTLHITLADFSPTLHITLADFSPTLHIRLADFSPTLHIRLADFSPTLAKFLFSARIYLAEQRNS